MELKFDETHCYRFDEAVCVTPNSELFKAQDLSFGRNVALKSVTIKGNNPQEQKANYKRAMQEVKTMIQISELTSKIPNIYTAYFDEKNSRLFIVMQWINGETLADKMQHNVPPVVFLGWMQELCRILDVMSKRNFYHKDIKPENIMFNENGDLYLIDFNLSVSAPNQTEGTMFYKAPEMDWGSITAARDKVDMFSIGVMLYQYSTGHLPRKTMDYGCYYNAYEEKWDFFKQPKDVRPNVDDGINQLTVKLMSYHPKDRYRNYAELANELRRTERSLKNAGKPTKRIGKTI